MLNDDLLDLRVGLLIEAMSKSDRKSIDKMIQKAIASDSIKQKKAFKKDFQKMLTDELKSVSVKDLVNDIVAKELNSKNSKDKIADVTKLVLRKLYRELAYSYTPVIDRIKV